MHKVLVVDDNPVDLKRIESIISGLGHEVVSAINGEQAIEAAKQHSPSVIFMDVNMPGVDGFAATRTLKGTDTTKTIPIIIVSSKGQKADKAWGQMLGAKGYITKPYSDSDVINEMKAL